MTEYGYVWESQTPITPNDLFTMNNAFKNVMKAFPNVTRAKVVENLENSVRHSYAFYFIVDEDAPANG